MTKTVSGCLLTIFGLASTTLVSVAMAYVSPDVLFGEIDITPLPVVDKNSCFILGDTGNWHLVWGDGVGVETFQNSSFGTPAPGVMSARYTPPYGVQGVDLCTGQEFAWSQANLHYAAKGLGFGGFNWLQVLIHEDSHLLLTDGTITNAPYVDPPYKRDGPRYLYTWSDDYIYYYDYPPYPSSSSANFDPQGTLEAHQFTDHLTFYDRPNRRFKEGEFVRFATHLVGTNGPNKWSILDSFYWSSNYNRFTELGSIYDFRNASTDLGVSPTIDSGGVFDVVAHVRIDEFSDDYKRFLISLGADNASLSPSAVSEPSSWSVILMLLSLLVTTQVLGLGVRLKDKKSNGTDESI